MEEQDKEAYDVAYNIYSHIVQLLILSIYFAELRRRSLIERFSSMRLDRTQTKNFILNTWTLHGLVSWKKSTSETKVKRRFGPY